ncbi:MAG: hypothetical protein Q4B52_05395 [Tissierellia bacterium]|nr:hypothetical protein [Tissierellia bacterium]
MFLSKQIKNITTNDFVQRKQNKFRKILTPVLATAGIFASPLVSFAAKVNVSDSSDMGTVAGGIVDVIIQITRYAGIVLLAVGFIRFLLAKASDNSNGMNSGVMNAMCGAAMVGFGPLLKLAGIIS